MHSTVEQEDHTKFMNLDARRRARKRAATGDEA